MNVKELLMKILAIFPVSLELMSEIIEKYWS